MDANRLGYSSYFKKSKSQFPKNTPAAEKFWEGYEQARFDDEQFREAVEESRVKEGADNDC